MTALPRPPPPTEPRPFARALSGAFLVNVAGTGAAFVSQIVLARAMGRADFGLYVYALAWVNVIAVFGKAGFDLSALRFVPMYDGARDWGHLRGFVRRSAQIALVAAVLLAAVFLAVTAGGTSRAPPLLRAAQAALLPVVVLLMLQGNVVQAFGRGVASQAVQNVARPLLVAATVLVATALGARSFGALTAMVANIAVAACCAGALLVMGRRVLPGEARAAAPRYDTRRWLVETAPLLALVGANYVLEQSDLLQTGWYLGAAAAGSYAAAARLALVVQIAVGSTTLIVAPMISRLHSAGQLRALQRVVTLATWANTAVAVCAAAALLVAGRWGLLLFGRDFADGYPVLALLAIGRVVGGSTAFSGYLLSLTGHQLAAVPVLLGGIGLNLAAGHALVPAYGPTGAAIAMASTMTLLGVASSVLCLKLVRINPTPFARPSRVAEQAGTGAAGEPELRSGLPLGAGSGAADPGA